MAVLSIITGGGKWVEMTIPADPPRPLAARWFNAKKVRGFAGLSTAPELPLRGQEQMLVERWPSRFTDNVEWCGTLSSRSSLQNQR
jgi:hypothetical protein